MSCGGETGPPGRQDSSSAARAAPSSSPDRPASTSESRATRIARIGVAALAAGDGEPGRAIELKQGSGPVLAILGGAALAFYALIGFEDSVNIAGETTRPERSYPVALFSGLAVAGAIYLLVTIVAWPIPPCSSSSASSSR